MPSPFSASTSVVDTCSSTLNRARAVAAAFREVDAEPDTDVALRRARFQSAIERVDRLLDLSRFVVRVRQLDVGVGRVRPARDHAREHRDRLGHLAVLIERGRRVQIGVDLDELLRIVRLRVGRLGRGAAGRIPERSQRGDVLGRHLARPIRRRDVVGLQRVEQHLHAIARPSGRGWPPLSDRRRDRRARESGDRCTCSSPPARPGAAPNRARGCRSSTRSTAADRVRCRCG